MPRQVRSVTTLAVTVCAMAICVIGIQGVCDLWVLPYWGFVTTDNRVTGVAAGSPAQRAGFLVGDTLVLDGGINATDVHALNERPWARQGETRTYVLRRDGRLVTAVLTFTVMPPSEIGLYGSKTVVGIVFAFIGWIVFWRAPSHATVLFSLACDGAAATMISEPYLSTVLLERLWYVFQVSWSVLGLAFLCHFAAVFPKVHNWAAHKLLVALAYAPAVLVVVAFLPTIFSGARFSRAAAASVMLVGVLYLASAATLLLRGYWNASRKERRAAGLNVMLVGTLAGLIPLLLPVLSVLFAPGRRIPGSAYLPFSMVLIVVSFAFACLRWQSAQNAELQLAAVAGSNGSR